jgi:carboxypeptidase Taq
MGVKDIPAYWNEQYRQLMGIQVPDDKHGCLQDVHWSHGSFGYFPTYSLGSFYAAQFYHYANQSITDLEAHIKQGNTTPLLQWLRTGVHIKGRRYTSEQLCKDICGETLNIQYFTGYLLGKYKDIYKF